MNEPVAFVTGIRQFDPVMANIVLKVGTPLYTHPAKTLTDEEYEKGFIDGMQKQMQSRVQQMVEGYAQMRELTDEEIWAIASEIEPIDLAYGVRLSNELNVLDFARAILRKAQEK